MIDFSDLSIYSKDRRRVLFSLNYSTSKPVHWLNSSAEALNVIKGFMEAFSFDDMLHGSGKAFGPISAGGLHKRTTTTTNVLQSPTRPIGGLTSPLRQYDESSRLMSPRQMTMQQQSINNLASKKSPFVFGLVEKVA